MTKVDELKDRLIAMIDQGCTGWHFSPGPQWHAIPIEEKAAALLDIWDAPKVECGPPKTNRTPMHVDDLIAGITKANRHPET